jgi:uncharacterized protein
LQQEREMLIKIVLSGASGMIGSALRTALAPHYEILRLVRRQPVSADEIEWHPETHPAFVQTSALEGLTAAIHLSGANIAGSRWTPAYKRELQTSRIDSTRALSTALATLRSRPQTLLVTSATGFYGNRGNEVLDESSRLGTGFLADLCRAWEAAADPARVAGIRVAHMRFGLVLNGKEGALAKMLPAFRMGLGEPMGKGRQWMNWIALEDLINAVIFLLERPNLAGPFNVVAPQSVTNADFARALGAALHRPAVLRAPAFALRLAFAEMADETLLASTRVVPKRLLDAGFQFRHPQIDEALSTALAER